MNKLFNKNIKIVLAVLFTVLFTVNFKITAQTKNTIEYRTSIIDQNQNPMSDGTYNFRFALYNVSSGGSALWSEDRTLQVRKAAISVDLGSINPFPQNLFKNTSLYLQICMDANSSGGDGSGECSGAFEENFKPRKIIEGVPWAFNASSLGPVTVTNGQTAYDLNAYGSDSTLLNLGFNDVSKFAVDSNGTVKLTEQSDILFGGTASLRNSASPSTSGASVIGVSTTGLNNLTGSTLQSVLTNLDPLLRWKANGSSVFYNGGNVGIGTNTPSFALDVIGTGNFTNGIILGNNTNTTAGAVRFAAGTFEGYDGVSWIPFAGAALSPWITNGTSIYYTTGNVGIGTTTPNRALEINGALRLDTIAQPGAPAAGDIYSSGTSLFYYNGTGWVNMTNDATTDNGAGMTYVTNVANSFGIGATTAAAAPYVFNPTTGALMKRNLTVQNTAATQLNSLLTLDSTGANAQVGGNKFGQSSNLAYTPSGGNGTQVYIANDLNVVVNAGDGTDVNRVRGYRADLTNNSSGVVDGLFAFTASSTNNGTLTFQTGYGAQLTNNGNVTSNLTGASFGTSNSGTVGAFVQGMSANATNNLGAITAQVAGSYYQTTNNGTTNFQYGTRNVVNNNGTANTRIESLLTGVENDGTTSEMYGTENYFSNNLAGVVTANGYGIFNDTHNHGTINNSYIGLYNVVQNDGSVGGDVIGISSSDGITTTTLNYNGVYAINTFGGPVKFSNQLVVGNSTGTAEAGSIRWTGSNFEGYNGSVWAALGGGGSSQWSNNGADIYFDTGFVGIANNAPAYQLDVTGTGNFTDGIIIGNNPNTVAGAMRFDGVNFQGYDGTIWQNLGAGAGSSQWSNNGANIYFDTANVGIGINTPTAMFDVFGTARIQDGLAIGAEYQGNFALEVSGAAGFSNEIVVGNSLNDTAGAIRFNGTNFEGYDGFGWNALGGGGGGGTQWFDDGLGGLYYNVGPIGIGGYPTSSSLTVQGETYLNGNVAVGIAPGGTYAFQVVGLSDFSGDVRMDGAITIATGTDPLGFYSLDVGGNTRIQDRMGIGTDSSNLFALNVLGDSNFDGDVYIQNGGLCVDGGSGCPALSPGGIYGDLAYSEFDVAENILANSDVEAGDIVSVLEGQSEVVRKSGSANESNVIGIISTDPGSLGGIKLKSRDGFKVVPLVLSGRVPVKVSTENGIINVGDPITSSSVAGVAMKATQSKTKIVGYAMQAYDQAGVAKIIVFYQPGYLP